MRHFYESAMYHISLLQKYDFDNIVISVKSSDVKTMIEAYRLLSANVKYPLHLGVTEAGSKERGAIKSAVGIGVAFMQTESETQLEYHLRRILLKKLQRGEGFLMFSAFQIQELR